MGKYEDYLEELVEEGKLDEEDAQRLADASPIRREAKEAKAEIERLKAQVEEREQYKDHALKATFRELEVPIDPSVLKLPDTIKPTDRDALTAYFEEKGIPYKKAEAVVDTAVANHEAIATASNGAEAAQQVSREQLFAEAKSPQEVAAIAAANPLK